MKFYVKDFFSKCDNFLRIWSHLLKKSLLENFIFCEVILTKWKQTLVVELLKSSYGNPWEIPRKELLHMHLQRNCATSWLFYNQFSKHFFKEKYFSELLRTAASYQNSTVRKIIVFRLLEVVKS